MGKMVNKTKVNNILNGILPVNKLLPKQSSLFENDYRRKLRKLNIKRKNFYLQLFLIAGYCFKTKGDVWRSLEPWTLIFRVGVLTITLY